MIKLEQLKLPLDYDEAALFSAVSERLGACAGRISEVRVIKRSVDARKKPRLSYVVSAAVVADREHGAIERGKATEYTPPAADLNSLGFPCGAGIVPVVGAGPAGLFAALTLARRGIKPIIIERGSDVDTRTAAIRSFRNGGAFCAGTNVQFGEGGAGTFSDGKLTTGTSSPFASAVVGELIAHGAPEEIRYLSHPHVGTDILSVVVKRIRGEILSLGGEVCFDTCVSDFFVRDGKLSGLALSGAHAGVIETGTAVLAIGHSARDTYERLRNSKVPMEQKPFSVGVRIEHLQREINLDQYGTADAPTAARYQAAVHLDDGRGVYTFCMCPGGEVLMAGSEEGGIATNGMSEYARDGVNGNSAVLVNVDSRDYGGELFGGIAYQRKIERAAFGVSGDYRAPVQRYDDFLRGKTTDRFGSVFPSICPKPVCADLNALIPKRLSDALKEGIPKFCGKVGVFCAPDAVLTGFETRSSAPVRILRDDTLQSPIAGLYPCGEGAGYAGGIMSAACDGIRVAERILRTHAIDKIKASRAGTGCRDVCFKQKEHI